MAKTIGSPHYRTFEVPTMRRVFVLTVALLAIGCSSHSNAVPTPVDITPQIFQHHISNDGWTVTPLQPINGEQANAVGLTVDAKHNVWVAAVNQSGVGSLTRIGMDQHASTFPLKITPDAIAFGSDSNLWITSGGNPNAGIVARVTPTGAATDRETDYVVLPGDHFSNIVSGPDGALWFTECSADLQTGGVGKITTSGSHTNFYVLQGCQYAIASGPDAKLWFGDGVNMYNVDPQNLMFTQFPVGDTFITGIATGSDGALYVTAAGIGYELLRVTTAGVVTHIGGDPNGDALGSIASGPDGNLWIYTFRQASRHLITFNPATSSWGSRIESHACGELIAGPDNNIWEPDCTRGLVDTYLRMAITLTPSQLSLSVGQIAQLAVGETNYSGPWTAISGNPSIASVTPNSNNGTFAVTGVAIGSTFVTVTDTNFNSANVAVTVR
jgi:virginiamycin B lyase